MTEHLQAFRRYAHAHFARLLVAAYVVTAVSVVVLHLVYGACIALSGRFAAKDLTVSDFEAVGAMPAGYQTVLTTTDDDQLIYDGPVRELDIIFISSQDPGEMVAFYTHKPNGEFGTDRMVYAQKYGDGYRFVFPDSTCRVRLDLGVYPDVWFDFLEIRINPDGWQNLFRFGTKDLFYGLVCPPVVLFLALALCDAAADWPRHRK